MTIKIIFMRHVGVDCRERIDSLSFWSRHFVCLSRVKLGLNLGGYDDETSKHFSKIFYLNFSYSRWKERDDAAKAEFRSSGGGATESRGDGCFKCGEKGDMIFVVHVTG
jgi:hypothetical protein